MNSSESRRVAAITGGAQGLGAAIGRRLHADGLTVVIGDVNLDGARSLASELGDRALGLGLDVTSDESVNEFAATVAATLGRLDVLVNNAGIISRAPAQDTDTAEWTRELDVNLGGTMRCSRACFDMLSRGDGASIINMGSVGSTLGLPLRLAYSSAKSAILGLTRTLAAEWGSYGIRVNALAPGYIETPMMRSGFDLGVLDEQALLERTPLHRLGASEEIAAAASFLASPDASFITGIVLKVDGGITIGGDFRPQQPRP